MIKKLCAEVAKEQNIPVEVVEEAYKSFWKFIRDTIQELPLKEDLTEEEFKNLKVNFNIPSIGKLGCTYERYLKIKQMFKENTKDDKIEED